MSNTELKAVIQAGARTAREASQLITAHKERNRNSREVLDTMRARQLRTAVKNSFRGLL